jgi:putative ABC transport system substrate-binding protein
MPRTGILIALALLGALFVTPVRAQTPRAPLIAITAITIDAEIQAMIDGIQDSLAERGYRPAENIEIEVANAEADPARAVEIVREFARRDARVVVAITTPSIEAALEVETRIPLVGAGLSLDDAAHYTNDRRRRPLTGVASGDTHGDQFEMIRALAPDTRTVAVPLDPSGGDIVARLSPLTAIARTLDLSVVPLPVSLRQKAVSNTIRELDPASSALFLDLDLLPGAPVEALAAAAGARGLPLFASTEDSVIRGALAAMVIEPHDVGEQVGALVALILEEPAAARAPFERARASLMIVNQEARALIDLTDDEPFTDDARRSIIDWADITGPRPRVKPSAPEEPEPLGISSGAEAPTPRARPPAPRF